MNKNGRSFWLGIAAYLLCVVGALFLVTCAQAQKPGKGWKDHARVGKWGVRYPPGISNLERAFLLETTSEHMVWFKAMLPAGSPMPADMQIVWTKDVVELNRARNHYFWLTGRQAYLHNNAMFIAENRVHVLVGQKLEGPNLLEAALHYNLGTKAKPLGDELHLDIRWSAWDVRFQDYTLSWLIWLRR